MILKAFDRIRKQSWGIAATVALLAGGLSACNATSLGSDDLGIPEDMAVFNGPFSDLPQDPMGAGGITSDMVGALSTAFGSAVSSPTGGPCMSEPTFGALYPRNFTPPLFEWTPGPNQNIFELRLHVDNQLNDLVIYTDQKSYTLSDTLWQGLTVNSQDQDIHVTLRGGQLTAGQLMGGVSTGSMGAVHIAPVAAQGAIVYWTTSSGTALKGFRIGDKKVQTVLSPATITTAGKTTTCVGCHASSPDGVLAFFGRTDPAFSVDARLVDGTSGAASASQVTANALANLARTNQDLPTMSQAHYTPSDAVVVTVMNNGNGGRWELNWTDLHATTAGTGIIPRTGDTHGAATPSWSHDGATIAYASSDNIVDGRLDTGNSDIWTVPYNGHNGGQAKALTGASDPTHNQYYPVYSPGDTFIAFNRNQRGSQMYDSASSEVFIVPAAGGAATRVAANDPPACTGQVSPGLTNSWPRWSPTPGRYNNKHYYWLVFSSKRRPGSLPQIFLSAIVTSDGAGGEVLEQAYPAVYIPTQPPGESNHTPAWDEFMIPIG